MSVILRILLLIYIFSLTSAHLKILGVTPFPSKFNVEPFVDLWKLLHENGHNVTVITSYPAKNVSYKQINVEETNDLPIEFTSIEEYIARENRKHNEAFRAVIQLPEVWEILKDERAKFDVVLADFTTGIWGVFGNALGCPTIGLLPNDLYWVHYLMGNPTERRLYADYNFKYPTDMSFSQIFYNIFYTIFQSFSEWYYFKKEREEYVNAFFQHEYSIEEIYGNVNMIFVNVIPGFHTIRPIGTNTIYIGGTKKYPSLQEIKLLEGKKKCIAIDFNGNKDIAKQIIEETTKMSYTFIWNSPNIPMQNNESNIIYLNEPHYNIFGQADILLFITTGSTVAIEQALHYKIPMLVIPTNEEGAEEELMNSDIIEREQFGRVLVTDDNHLDPIEFKNVIYGIIFDNSRYRNRMIEFSKELERPISGIEEAAWWVKHLGKHKNVEHLRNPYMKLTNSQRSNFDLTYIFLLWLIMIIWLIRYLGITINNFLITQAAKKEKQF